MVAPARAANGGVVALQACVAMRCGGRFRRGHGEQAVGPGVVRGMSCRSQTLAHTATFSPSLPDRRQVRAWVQEACRFIDSEYAERFEKPTMLLFAE